MNKQLRIIQSKIMDKDKIKQNVIGLSLPVAINYLSALGMNVRIERTDDSFYPGFEVFIPNRFNLEVDNNIVTNITFG